MLLEVQALGIGSIFAKMTVISSMKKNPSNRQTLKILFVVVRIKTNLVQSWDVRIHGYLLFEQENVMCQPLRVTFTCSDGILRFHCCNPLILHVESKPYEHFRQLSFFDLHMQNLHIRLFQ